MRQRLHHRGVLLVAVCFAAIAACGTEAANDAGAREATEEVTTATTGNEPVAREAGVYVTVSIAEDDPTVLEVAREIIEQRLADAGSGRVTHNDGELEVWLPLDTDPDLIGAIVARGEVSMRPVLAVEVVSPFVGVDDAPVGIDPATGLSVEDDPFADVWLPGDDEFVYQVGPAALRGDDFLGAEVETAGQSRVVNPDFTDDGGAKFVELTKALSVFAPGDPRRQLAIVVDGRVVSAPQLGAELPPGQGLEPDVVVISIGDSGPDAALLAAYLRYGALPPVLEVTTEVVSS